MTTPPQSSRRITGTASDATAAMALNQTKFLPPLSSLEGVPREHLLNALEQEAEVHLVLLLAPAGYGKTTLMGQWRELIVQRGGHVGWLRLDEADNDPARLMCYLYGALRSWIEIASGGSEATLFMHDDWMSLLDRIGPGAPRLTLFLDECEQLTTPAALRVAKLLVDRLPRLVRLVISSREKPPLKLERYRVRGELLELTAANLRFDAGETRRFLGARMAEAPAGWVVERMQAITEGWPAALQLTALAARSREQLERYAYDLSGSLAHIADYLAEDVLNAQSAEVRSFLLETCGLPRLCDAVCDAATGRTDGRHMLQFLARRGLFTVPLDSGHHWYRYHPLFAEFLRSQQTQALPREQVVATHRGAAQWFARHGTAMEAVDLWLLAGDSKAAIREMAGCARELVRQAQFGTILRWIGRLDETALAAAGPELPLAAAWACGFGGEPEAAMRWLQRLKPSLEASGEHGALYDELIALESILMALRGDTRAALETGLAHWRKIGAGQRFAAGALANVISYCLMLDGDFARARGFSNQARLFNEEIGSALGLGYALSVSGLIEAIQGNLDQALDQFHEVDKMAGIKLRQPWFETTHVKVASVGLIASVLYEQDRLDEAEELLQRYLPLLRHQPSIDMLLLSHVIRARVKMAQGDLDAALATLAQAERRNMGSGWQSAGAHRIIEWERVRIDLIGGRREHALARAETLERMQPDDIQRNGYSFVEELCGHGIEFIRCAIARGHAETALTRLESEIAPAQAGGRRWRLLKLKLLRSLAFDLHGSPEAAQAELLQTLQLGRSMGARRSFFEEGSRLETLLAELPAQAFGALEQGDALTRYWLDLRGELPSLAERPALTGKAVLSERESSILKLLAIGMGNEQIAAQVFLSVNTVKWHIRRILEKLEARNRSEAVFVARRLGLIGG